MVVSPSSTSDGWNMVYCESGVRLSSEGISSTDATPSSDQPCELATAAQLFGGLGERDVEAALAQARALQQELQRQRRLARAGVALDEVQPIARKATAEDIIKASDPGCDQAWLGSS